EEAPVAEKEYFGYAHGMMDGEYFSVENTDSSDGLWIGIPEIDETPHWDTIAVDSIVEVVDSIIKIQIVVPERKQCLYVDLAHLRIGTFYEDTKESPLPIHVEIKANPPGLSRYVQKSECPTRIDLTQAEKGWFIPTVEGVINGTFYNDKNPKDSIVVEDVKFGIHYY
ncbi:MAG: DUF5025 domain-containing protein, partial [Mediterranea sp.]|nr:DUF5025 domain-containing protein [Mediterranea sp.]